MGLNTIIYSEGSQAFMSFSSVRPKWHLDFGDRYYSFDENDRLYLHNSNSIYNQLNVTVVDSVGSPIVHLPSLPEPSPNSNLACL